VPSEEHELLAERLGWPLHVAGYRAQVRTPLGWVVRGYSAVVCGASPAVPVVRQRARMRMRVSGNPMLVGLEGGR
jgi:hypothetical protein